MSDEQMHLRPRGGLELPLRTAPIRFAVTREDGRTSNSWGVRVESKGDAYIFHAAPLGSLPSPDRLTRGAVQLSKSAR